MPSKVSGHRQSTSTRGLVINEVSDNQTRSSSVSDLPKDSKEAKQPDGGEEASDGHVRKKSENEEQNPDTQSYDPLSFVLQPEEEILKLESVIRDVLKEFKRERQGVFVADCSQDSVEGESVAYRVSKANIFAFNQLRIVRKGDLKQQRFNFLVQELDRPQVAATFSVTLDTLDKILRSSWFRPSDLRESEYPRLAEPPHTGPALFMQTIMQAKSVSEIICFLSIAVSVGIASYANSHCHDISPDSALEPAEELHIRCGGKLSLVCRKRRLSCLDQFIGGPVWIFTNPASDSDNFILSTTVSEFADLWGPVWGIGSEVSAGMHNLFTERGEIVEVEPSQKNYHVVPRVGEIPCHWEKLTHLEYLERREVVEMLLGLWNSPRTFTASSSLVIGMAGAHSRGFRSNGRCPGHFNSALEQGYFDAGIAGSQRGGWELMSRGVTLNCGHFVTIGATQNHRSVPASTQKDRIYAIIQGARTLAFILPVLRLHVGLEISICTGNAKRISLWEALKASCIGPTRW